MSNFAIGASIKTTKVRSNIQANEIDLYVYNRRRPPTGRSLIDNYTGFIQGGNPYVIVYLPQVYYYAKVIRNLVNVGWANVYQGTSMSDLRAAVNAYLGYNYQYQYSDGYLGADDEIYVYQIDYVDIYKVDISNNSVSNLTPAKPCYIDLLRGYRLDPRVAPSIKAITPTKSGFIDIGYYRQNLLEPIPGLKSIDWIEHTVLLEENKPILLPIVEAVLGGLWISDPDIEAQIKELPNLVNEYAFSDYFPLAVSGLFSYWNTLFANAIAIPDQVPTGTLAEYSTSTLISTNYKVIGANNNVWNNASPIDDINADITHPMFAVDSSRTYNYHFKPQLNGSFGDLVMDSPRLINMSVWMQDLILALEPESNKTTDLTSTPPKHTLGWHITNGGGDSQKVKEIHKALEADKYSKNELNPNAKRVTSLGWLINRQAEVLGIRYNANGKIDKDKEKKLAREVIPANKVLDQKKYGGSCFGDEKLLVRRLNNHFGKNGIESGGVVGVADLPQLMLEVLDQLNLSLGVQESSAIEIKHDGQTHRYPNLLALVTEIAIHQFNQSQYSKSTHISSLVTQQQTGEIIGGLGLPTVSKQLLRTVNGNNAAIPYWGIAPQASIAKKIDTCAYNVGLVLGQVT